MPSFRTNPSGADQRNRFYGKRATDFAADSLHAEIDLKVFSAVSLAGSGIAAFMGMIAIGEGRWRSAIMILAIAAGVAINLLVTRRRREALHGLNVLATIATVLLLAICINTGSPTPPATMLLAALPFVFAIIGARRSMLIWLGIIAAALVFLYFVPALGLNLPVEPLHNMRLLFVLEVGILTLFISLAAYTGVRGRRTLLNELNRAKLEIEHARDEAIKANVAKSEFLARVSHELRTPLNGIIGFSQILSFDAANPLNARQRERMHFIEASAQSLLSLVNEILDITHIESGVMKLLLEPLDLAAVLAETSGTVEPMARDAQLQLTVLPAPPLWVLADAQRLRQSLSNLLSNAIKYNRPQGRVEVSTSASDDEVRIAILDTGHGLGAEEITRLFQPFNRLGAASSTIEGSGLGLVITRTLVERMNGRLEVESTPGSGSCFSIILPRHAPPRVAPAAAHATLAAARPALVTVVDGGPRKVLYVEDNPVNVQLMEAMFERLPQVELHIANTGAAGLEIARAVHPDLLLLDINLPDCNGIELLASINAGNAARTPAIAVSADAMPDDIRHALDSGFDDYWTKPLDMVKKLQALSAMLATPIRL